MTKMFTEIAIH